MKPKYEIKQRQHVTVNEEFRYGAEQPWGDGTTDAPGLSLDDRWVEVRPKAPASPPRFIIKDEHIATTIAEMVKRQDLDQWEYASVDEYTSWENWAESWVEDDEDDPDHPVIVRRVKR